MSRLSGIGVEGKVAPDEPAWGELALAAAAIPLPSKPAIPWVTTGPLLVGPMVTVDDVESGTSAHPTVCAVAAPSRLTNRGTATRLTTCLMGSAASESENRRLGIGRQRERASTCC